MYLDGTDVKGAIVGGISMDYDENGVKSVVVSIVDTDNTPSLAYQNYKFIQTKALTEAGVAVHPWGGIIIPYDEIDSETLEIALEFDGTIYTTGIANLATIGAELTFSEEA